jgi:hypothetical protein
VKIEIASLVFTLLVVARAYWSIIFAVPLLQVRLVERIKAE